MVVDNIKNDPRLAQSEREAFLGVGIQAYITTPLIKDGKWVASVTVHQVHPRAWRLDEIMLVEEVAERTWAAVERAKAEEALRASRERLRLIIETARGYAIFTTDSKGVINSWNVGAAQIFGWTETEILGQNSEVLFTPEDRANGEAKKELETARSQGIAPDIRWHQRRDGSRVFIHGEVRPLRDGQIHGFVKIGRDLTAQRQAEEALHENQKQLQVLNETLEQQVQEKTAEVRQVASELIKATQQERLRISHLLHDDLQQSIYAIQMQMTFLTTMLKDGQDAARKEAEDIASQLNEILEMTRQLSIDLSPPILRGEGLWHAIHWLAGRMQQHYGLPIELRAEGSFVIRDKELHVLLFNCVRELLFNIVKHANASRAVVELEQLDDNRLHIEIRDNGNGFPTDGREQQLPEGETLPRSLGLVTIRHQLSLFDGTMDIRSRPGVGTQVSIIVPVPQER
jgi:PAS domain S-box-containing protein